MQGGSRPALDRLVLMIRKSRLDRASLNLTMILSRLLVVWEARRGHQNSMEDTHEQVSSAALERIGSMP